MHAPDRLARTVLVVGLVLAASTPLAWELMTPPADAGTLPAAEVTASPQPVTASPQPTTADAARQPGPAPDAGADGRGPGSAVERDPRPSTRSARIADLDATPSPVPERLRIPSIDVAAPIVAVGVEDTGALQVPHDVGDVGWYRHGPAPGEPGATVIAGHVDSRAQGRGAFFDLRDLDVGARVQVTDSAGDVHRYHVDARRTYDKASLPADMLFSRAGPSRLVLITCGGDFDKDTRSYRDNVTIHAQPS